MIGRLAKNPYPFYKLDMWIGEWIGVTESLLNIFLIPFGFHITHWRVTHAFYTLKKIYSRKTK